MIQFYTNSDVHQEVRKMCESGKTIGSEKYFTFKVKNAKIFVVADQKVKMCDLEALYINWLNDLTTAKKVLKNIPNIEVGLNDYDLYSGIHNDENFEYECDWFDIKCSLYIEQNMSIDSDTNQIDVGSEVIEIDNLQIVLEDRVLKLDPLMQEKIIKEIKKSIEIV